MLPRNREEPQYIQNRKRAEKERKEAEKHQASLSAVHRIVDQLSANEAKEQADHQDRAFREKLTIWLLIGTIVVAAIGDVIFYNTLRDAHKNAEEQVGKMAEEAQLTRDSNKINRDAIAASNRAWVGVSKASITGPITINKPLIVDIGVFNSGREPAKSFTNLTDLLTTTGDTEIFELDISSYVAKCFATPPRPQAQVLYPTVGFGGATFDFQTTLPANQVDSEIISGAAIVVARGCLTYQTSGETKHSSFCFYYKGGVTKPDNLNICNNGSDAD